MERIVLLGTNIAHSRSPEFHNRLFAKHNLPYQYELLPVTPEELPGAIMRMKRGGYRGANVTSPYKELAFELVDKSSESVRHIGSVNTILFEEKRAIGFNTDVDGFAASLQGLPLLDKPFTAAVLGTGGAARAAVDVLLRHQTLQRITLYSQSSEKADHETCRWDDPRLSGEALPDFEPADLIVHATPVGLPGVPGRLLNPDDMEGGKLLYEMIYHPPVTELMKAARTGGLQVMNGEKMFIGQAEKAFEIWVGSHA